MGTPLISRYIQYGVPQKIAEILDEKGIGIKAFRTLKKEQLVNNYELDVSIVDYVKKAISRKKISTDILFSLLDASNYTCCCCKKKDGGYVVHHIISYEETQDRIPEIAWEKYPDDEEELLEVELDHLRLQHKDDMP